MARPTERLEQNKQHDGPAWGHDGGRGPGYPARHGADPSRTGRPVFSIEPLPHVGAPGIDVAGMTFEVVSAEGAGGQSSVYKVRALDGGAGVFAVKLFATRVAAEREWDVLMAHRNEATVPLGYSFGILSGAPAATWGGRYAVVMEYVEGATLERLLGDEGYRGTLTLEEALRVIAPIVRFCANSQDSRSLDVHRDIKPANIMIGEDGRVRLIDFGISAGSGGAFEARGTMYYSAPEIYEPDIYCRENGGDIADFRIDTYGIAATLAAMLGGTGRPPAYGAVGERFEPDSYRHDDQMVARLVSDVFHDLERKRVPDLSEAVAARAVDLALARMDAKVARRIAECLAVDQDARPFPSELESILPLNVEHYRNELFSSAVIGAMRTTPQTRIAIPGYREEVDADKDFIVALTDFNSGYYGRAVPILQKLAAAGDLSAMYYLGVCMRDGLGPYAGQDLSAEVAYYCSRAAEAGNTLAMNAYGQMLYEGVGVGVDRREGRRRVADSARDDPASGKVGFLYAKRWLEEHPEEGRHVE